MSKANITELAKQGNSQAIASLLNRTLESKGFRIAKATLKKDCLQLMLESKQVPPQQKLVAFIRESMTRLGSNSTKKVKIYGRKIGEEFPEWTEEFDLTISVKPNLKELAQQGDIEAINTLIKKWIKSNEIYPKILIKNNCLQIILESNQVPNRQLVISQIKPEISQLDIANCDKVNLYGKEIDDDFLEWHESFQLQPQIEEFQFSEKTEKNAIKPVTESGSVSSQQSLKNSVIQSKTKSLETVKNRIFQGIKKQKLSDSISLEAQLSERMIAVFDRVIEERRRYYSANPEQIPTPENIETIVQSYAITNSRIAIAGNIVPGPLGLLTAISEITLIIHNHVAMLYDIGLAYGKVKVLDKELLAGIFSYALGLRGIGLISVQGTNVVVTQVTSNLFEQIISALSQQFIQLTGRFFAGKCFLIAGVIAMSAWAKYSTREFSKKATLIFKQNIEKSNKILDFLSLQHLELIPSDPNVINDVIKIQALINLMNIDGKIEEKEREYINLFISKADATERDKKNLLNSIDENCQFPIDYSQFANS
ncbi:MAG: hypothetical protein ACOC04_03050, partial [Halothece sp.]